MRLRVDRKSFLGAFETAAAFVNPRSPSEVLKGIKLAADAEATLMGTDMEHGASVRILGTTIELPGSCILPAEEMRSILKNATDAELVIAVAGSNISVRGENAEFDFPSEDPDLFPEIPGFPASGYHVVTAKDFRACIDRTAYATTSDRPTMALAGCLIDFEGDRMIMAASDGKRISEAMCPFGAEGDAVAVEDQMVVPARSLKLITRYLSDDDPPVHFLASDKSFLVRTETAVIYSQLLAGRFPPYRRAMPETIERAFGVKAADFLAAINQASVCTSVESKGVEFRFDPGVLTLSAFRTGGTDRPGSRSKVCLPIGYEGTQARAVFDPKYLVEPLKCLGADIELDVSLTEIKHRIACRTDGYTFVVASIER